MADSTITLQGVILKDNWPGAPVSPPVANYQDMTAAAVGHNLAAPLFPVGTKWQVYNSGRPTDLGVKFNVGFSTFVYLKGAADIATAVAAVTTVICVPDDTLAAGNPAEKMYTVVADSDLTTHEGSGMVAVALSTMTNSYYGWFWCGGVAPTQYVAGFTVTATLVTDDSLTASCDIMTVASVATGIALKIATAGSPSCGIALYVDGT